MLEVKERGRGEVTQTSLYSDPCVQGKYTPDMGVL